MQHPDADKWNAIYSAGEHKQNNPARVLQEYTHLLPATGTALDVACGTGANTILLARHGLAVSAWDISEEAITCLRNNASQQGLHIDTRICDITADPPPANSFDVIIVSYFLDRELLPALIVALKSGGLLFYQTFSQERVDDSGPKNNDYRLARNELLQLCRDLHIILYHEEGRVGDIHKGFRNEVMLIAQRP